MEKIKKYIPLWDKWQIDTYIGSGSFGEVYKLKFEEENKINYSAARLISISWDQIKNSLPQVENITNVQIEANMKSIAVEIVKKIQIMKLFNDKKNILKYGEYSIYKHRDGKGYDIVVQMEYLTSIKTFIDQTTIPIDEVIKLGLNICDAFLDFREKNIIHKKVCPENIFMDSEGNYKIGDFGIGRPFKSFFSNDFEDLNIYTAPEVFKSKKYNLTVDTYSLSLLMYQLLNYNYIPFLETNKNEISNKEIIEAVNRRFLGENLKPPKNAPKKLSDIILKGCSFNLEERFSSPNELIDILKKYLLDLNKKEENIEVKFEEEFNINLEDMSFDDVTDNSIFNDEKLLLNKKNNNESKNDSSLFSFKSQEKEILDPIIFDEQKEITKEEEKEEPEQFTFNEQKEITKEEKEEPEQFTFNEQKEIIKEEKEEPEQFTFNEQKEITKEEKEEPEQFTFNEQKEIIKEEKEEPEQFIFSEQKEITKEEESEQFNYEESNNIKKEEKKELEQFIFSEPQEITKEENQIKEQLLFDEVKKDNKFQEDKSFFDNSTNNEYFENKPIVNNEEKELLSALKFEKINLKNDLNFEKMKNTVEEPDLEGHLKEDLNKEVSSDIKKEKKELTIDDISFDEPNLNKKNQNEYKNFSSEPYISSSFTEKIKNEPDNISNSEDYSKPKFNTSNTHVEESIFNNNEKNDTIDDYPYEDLLFEDVFEEKKEEIKFDSIPSKKNYEKNKLKNEESIFEADETTNNNNLKQKNETFNYDDTEETIEELSVLTKKKNIFSKNNKPVKTKNNTEKKANKKKKKEENFDYFNQDGESLSPSTFKKKSSFLTVLARLFLFLVLLLVIGIVVIAFNDDATSYFKKFILKQTENSLPENTNNTNTKIDTNIPETEQKTELEPIANLNLPKEYNFVEEINIEEKINEIKNKNEVTNLKINKSNIKDLNIISDFIALKDLEISNSELESIEGINNFVNVEILNLSSNKIVDLHSDLDKLVNIKELNLSNNLITNVEPLSKLLNISILDISNNMIGDLQTTFLSNLIKMESLNLASTNITDVSEISKLINLKILNLDKNNITSIESLEKLINLENISINENNITDISSFSSLEKLKILRLAKNKIEDISPLENKLEIEQIILRENTIKNFESLKLISNLTTLDLGGTRLTDLSVLEDLKNLKVLSIAGNSISDYSILSKLVNLEQLYVYQTNIIDLKAIENLKSLKILNLTLTNVKDLSPLQSLDSLEELNLQGTLVDELVYLDKLPKLRKLILPSTFSDEQLENFKTTAASKDIIEIIK